MTTPTPSPASASPIMRWFSYSHLPAGFSRDISNELSKLANTLERVLPAGPEKSAALRHLLEAKDAAVRAAITWDTA